MTQTTEPAPVPRLPRMTPKAIEQFLRDTVPCEGTDPESRLIYERAVREFAEKPEAVRLAESFERFLAAELATRF